MKKFFSTLIVLAVITTAAVAETKMLSVNFAVPVDTINTKHEITYMGSETLKQQYTGIGFGVSGVNMFSKIVGLYTDVELGFFQSYKLSYAGMEGTAKRKEVLGDDGKQFSMNFLIGPAFKIFENDKIFLSAAPAGHWYMNYESIGNNATSGGFLGLGANATFAFFFNDVVGISAGLDFAFDFLGYGDYRKEEESYSISGVSVTESYKNTHINFTPKFGVSFKF